MGTGRQRDQRQAIILQARLRHDGGWQDVTICNVSTRGLMLKGADPPPRGTFVEVRRADCSIVGHVRWSTSDRFGVRSQDIIDHSALTQDRKAKSNQNDRRAFHRTHHATPDAKQIANLEHQGRRFAHFADWLVIAMAGILAAAVVAEMVGSAFGTSMRQVRAAMEVQQ